jgi:hypothetical protein
MTELAMFSLLYGCGILAAAYGMYRWAATQR